MSCVPKLGNDLVYGGLNGSYTLTPGVTVFDDGGVDMLTAGSEQDWFLVGLKDKLTNQKKNETVTTN
jgi:hypothetical protein